MKKKIFSVLFALVLLLTLSLMTATPAAAQDSASVDLTASSPAVIGISVEPASVDFGSVTPGVASAPQTVTVTNTGNVAEDFSATLENISTPDVYTTGLTIDASLVTGWSAPGVAVGGNVVPELILTVPIGTAPGTYTATLVFWAEKGVGN